MIGPIEPIRRLPPLPDRKRGPVDVPPRPKKEKDDEEKVPPPPPERRGIRA